MGISDEFRSFVCELLAPVGPIAIRPMFGGAGVLCDGVMIALLADDMLYLKTDDETRPTFEAAGSQPFTFVGKARTVVMSYWLCPDHALDDRDAMCEWGDMALAAALREALKKTGKPQTPVRKAVPRRRKAN